MLEFDKGYYCKNGEYIINKQKHQIDKNVRRKDQHFSTRLPYADKKITEFWMNTVNTTYIATEDMFNKLQCLKGKKLKFYKKLSNYFDEIRYKTFKFEEDPFSKNDQVISKIHHEVLLLIKFLQTKPQVKNMNINYYDLFYTVIKNRDEKEKVDDKYENNESDYINYQDCITPNH